jgi:hypothetical protein
VTRQWRPLAWAPHPLWTAPQVGGGGERPSVSNQQPSPMFDDAHPSACLCHLPLARPLHVCECVIGVVGQYRYIRCANARSIPGGAGGLDSVGDTLSGTATTTPPVVPAATATLPAMSPTASNVLAKQLSALSDNPIATAVSGVLTTMANGANVAASLLGCCCTTPDADLPVVLCPHAVFDAHYLPSACCVPISQRLTLASSCRTPPCPSPLCGWWLVVRPGPASPPWPRALLASTC